MAARRSPRSGGAEHRRALLEGQSTVIDLVARGAGLVDVLNAVAALIDRHAAPARSAVVLFDREARRLRQAAAPQLPAGLLDALGAAAPWAAALASGERADIADLRAAPAPLRDHAIAAGLRACRFHPIGGDRLLGAFILFHRDAASLRGDDDRGLLDLLAPVARIAAELDHRTQALHSADERFVSLAASVPGVVYQRVVSPEGQIRYTYINEGVRDLFGVTPAEVLADPEALFSRHDPSYAATFRERLLSASRSLEMWDVEATIISRDGAQKFTHAIARPKKQADGSVVWNGVILDQTRIKKAELAAAAAEARTRIAIVESLSQGIALFDASDRLMVCNSALLRLYPTLEGIAQPGAAYAAVIRAELEHEGVTPQGALELQLAQRLEQHREQQHAIERRLPDGRSVLIDELRTAEGGTVILHSDITQVKRREEERGKLQDQLYTAQKMDAMGRLAGGIAHDFNNLLASILGNASFLIEDLPADSETRDFAQQIKVAGERAKRLVQQILAFSRQQGSEQTNIDPEAIIEETVQLLRPALPKPISLNVRLHAPKATIRGNSTQLVQVLVNLCVNARDAIGERHGAIDLETDLLGPRQAPALASPPGEPPQGARRISTGQFRPATPYLCVRVRDNGTGIDPRILERIFEPFFTTKEVGKGTGLGLAAVHGIVAAHDGVIAVTSQPGGGATFEVFLPTIAAAPSAGDSAVAEAKPSGSEAILIVDDEEQVGVMLANMLRRLGYKIDCFGHAPDALAAFEESPDAWSLVITDQMMPQMTGFELARKMLARVPDLPIILCSGYTDGVSQASATEAGIRAFLAKPADHLLLARTIRGLLDARAGCSSPVHEGVA